MPSGLLVVTTAIAVGATATLNGSQFGGILPSPCLDHAIIEFNRIVGDLIPEPATLGLIALGRLRLVAGRRRTR